MWWKRPLLRGYKTLLGPPLLEVVARAFSLVRSSCLHSSGPERGRDFERLFYGVCRQAGLRLTERAGARTISGQENASGYWHEVDAATRSVRQLGYWELKHLRGAICRDDLLLFNGKGLDFYQGCNSFSARIPFMRFLLSGGMVEERARRYASLWGIVVIEPGRLPLSLIYEAIARGMDASLKERDIQKIKSLLLWGCSPLQDVIRDMVDPLSGPLPRKGPEAVRLANRVVDLQEHLSEIVLDVLEEESPEWMEDSAAEVLRSPFSARARQFCESA